MAFDGGFFGHNFFSVHVLKWSLEVVFMVQNYTFSDVGQCLLSEQHLNLGHMVLGLKTTVQEDPHPWWQCGDPFLPGENRTFFWEDLVGSPAVTFSFLESSCPSSSKRNSAGRGRFLSGLGQAEPASCSA